MATDLSFLEPAFSSMAQMAGIFKNIQAAAQQQDELAEQKRAAQANEAIAGRHADIAANAQRDKEQQDEFQNTLSLNAQGAQPLSSDGTYTMPMPAAVPLKVAPTMGPQDTSDLNNMPLTPAPAMPAGQVQVQPDSSDMTVHFGGKLYRIPPMDEQTMAEAGRQSVIGSAADDVKLKKYGVTLPPALADEFGMDPGQKILPDHLNALAQIHQAMNPPEPVVAAPKSLVGVHREDDKGNATDQFYDPTSGELVKTTKTPGIGRTAEAAPKTATPGQFAGVEKDKAAALANSQKSLNDELKTAQENYAKDDTFDRVGAIKQAYANHYARMQQAQLTYEARRSELSGQDVGHNSWADDAAAAAAAQPGTGAPAAPPRAAAAPAAPAAPAANAPKAPAPAAAGPKIATMADIDAFAAKQRITRAQAIKAAQAKGYKIGTVQ
jgi:hypothetical protein